jgi:hypothetical protein
MRARTLPDADAGFHTAQETITDAADKNREAWNIDVQWFIEELLPKKARWVAAWTDYLVPATRTPLITFTKNKTRKEYEKPLRLLVKNLESNPRVSDEDRRGMGITIPSTTRTVIPAATTYPLSTVDSSTIRLLKFFFRDSESSSKAKPHGVHGAEIRWSILDTPPVTVKELIMSGFDTRSPFTLEFENDQRGKTVWYCLRWENTKGEKGPWSEIGSAIIP